MSISRVIYTFTILVSIALQGCGSASHIQKLNPPERPPEPPSQYISRFDIEPHQGQLASIGDDLFRISRFKLGPGQSTAFKAPTGENFPFSAIWQVTHIYNDPQFGHLKVFTTPSFYSGSIGIALDETGRLSIPKPLMQVDGIKTGRAWAMSGAEKFFYWSESLVERWGVRYGGKKGSDYSFELFNKNEANVTEIIQSIEIDDTTFLKGFTIRGVFIQGLKADESGVIKYRVDDKRI